MKAGIHNLSAAEYHADPAAEPSLSSSICVELLQRSPLHAWHAHPRLNQNYRPENNAIMDAGTVAHQILLQGSMDKIVVVQADDWRTKVAKEQRDQAWANGGIPVLAGKLEAINAMVEVAKRYVGESELAGIFDRGDPELTLLWQDGPAWCRARPDWWTTDRSIMLDVKTTGTSAEPNAFVRQILNMGHDVQAAFNRRGAFALAKELPDFVFLVIENEPPYACSLIGMAPAMIDLAERKVDFALTLWKNCTAKNQWNGYPRRICHAEPPEYAVRSFEEFVDQGGQA